jgi:hypothetical protein
MTDKLLPEAKKAWDYLQPINGSHTFFYLVRDVDVSEPSITVGIESFTADKDDKNLIDKLNELVSTSNWDSWVDFELKSLTKLP